MKKIIPYYALFTGLGLLILHTVIYYTTSVKENEVVYAYRIVPEITTALFCITGSLYLFTKKRRGKIYTLVGLSMALYSMLESASYYINDTILFYSFNVLAIITLPFVLINAKLLMNQHSASSGR